MRASTSLNPLAEYLRTHVETAVVGARICSDIIATEGVDVSAIVATLESIRDAAVDETVCRTGF